MKRYNVYLLLVLIVSISRALVSLRSDLLCLVSIIEPIYNILAGSWYLILWRQIIIYFLGLRVRMKNTENIKILFFKENSLSL